MERNAAPGVERVFGECSDHGPYELPLGSIDHGDIERRCPACPNADRPLQFICGVKVLDVQSADQRVCPNCGRAIVQHRVGRFV